MTTGQTARCARTRRNSDRGSHAANLLKLANGQVRAAPDMRDADRALMGWTVLSERAKRATTRLLSAKGCSGDPVVPVVSSGAGEPLRDDEHGSPS
jgi:hypothetical protein